MKARFMQVRFSPAFFQIIPPDDGKILKDAQSKSQKGDIIKIDAEAVPRIDEKSRQKTVDKKARHEHHVVETVVKSGPEAAKNGVKAGKKILGKTHASYIRYLSTNTDVATVSRNGKITGKKAGTCTVYAIGVNGVWKSVKVTIK